MIKSLLKRFRLIRDYIGFVSTYHEATSFRCFLYHRYFPFFSRNIYWPVSNRSEARGKIVIGRGARVGHRPGCIIQGRGKVFIGDYVEIGPNSVIVSGNHGLLNQNAVVRKETIIGDYCWIASNVSVLGGGSFRTSHSSWSRKCGHKEFSRRLVCHSR